jgi:hypothetical protein
MHKIRISEMYFEVVKEDMTSEHFDAKLQFILRLSRGRRVLLINLCPSSWYSSSICAFSCKGIFSPVQKQPVS